MADTKIIDVDSRFGEEWQGRYVFREITNARAEYIVERNTEFDRLSGQIAKQDNVKIEAEMIVASLTMQPKGSPVTLEKLMALEPDQPHLPRQLHQVFKAAMFELNVSNQEAARFLLERLDGASRTELFSSFGYQKSLEISRPLTTSSTQARGRASGKS